MHKKKIIRSCRLPCWPPVVSLARRPHSGSIFGCTSGACEPWPAPQTLGRTLDKMLHLTVSGSFVGLMPLVCHPRCCAPDSSPKYVLQKHPSWIKVFLHLSPSQWLSAESYQTQMAFPTLRVFWCCHWILSFGSMPGSKLEFPKAHPTRSCKAFMLRRGLLMKLAWISLGYLLSSQTLRPMCVARLSVRKPLSLTGICRDCLFLDMSTG